VGSEPVPVAAKPAARLLLIVLGLVLAMNAAVWFKYAPRFFVFNLAAYREHWPHARWLLLRVGGGTLAPFLGLVGLWTVLLFITEIALQ
jgi:hypothetical protein